MILGLLLCYALCHVAGFCSKNAIKDTILTCPECPPRLQFAVSLVSVSNLLSTLAAEMFGGSDFRLETRVIIKISTHPW